MIYLEFQGIFLFGTVLLHIDNYSGENIPKDNLFELLFTGFTYFPSGNGSKLGWPKFDIKWYKDASKRFVDGYGYDPRFNPGGTHHPVLEKFFSSLRRRFRGQSEYLALYVAIDTNLQKYHYTDLFFVWKDVYFTIDLATDPSGIKYVPRNNHMVISPEDVGVYSNLEEICLADVIDFSNVANAIKEKITSIERHQVTNRTKYKRMQRIMHQKGIFCCLEGGD